MRNFRCQLENVQIETVLNIWRFGLKATASAHYAVYCSDPGSERTAAWLSGRPSRGPARAGPLEPVRPLRPRKALAAGLSAGCLASLTWVCQAKWCPIQWGNFAVLCSRSARSPRWGWGQEGQEQWKSHSVLSAGPQARGQGERGARAMGQNAHHPRVQRATCHDDGSYRYLSWRW